MKTKTTRISLLTLLIVGSFMLPLILAETNESLENNSESLILANENTNQEINSLNEEELGLKEDVSDMAIAWKRFKLWFTFNQEKKIERELELARLRLAQANMAAKMNDSSKVEKALEAYNRIMEKVQKRVNSMAPNSDSRELNSSIDKLVGLERAIQNHEERVMYLKKVLENSNLSETQRARIQKRLNQLENTTNNLVRIQEKNMERTRTRLMAIENLSEEQAKNLMQQRQEQLRTRVNNMELETVKKGNSEKPIQNKVNTKNNQKR